jgi:hypothetical protein
MLPLYVLKLGTYLIIYTVLFFSQEVIYTNVYDPIHSYEPRGKRGKLSKWLNTMKDWLTMKAKVIGTSIKKWNQTQKVKCERPRQLHFGCRHQIGEEESIP